MNAFWLLKSNRDVKYRALMQKMNQNNIDLCEDRVSYSNIDTDGEELFWIPWINWKTNRVT